MLPNILVVLGVIETVKQVYTLPFWEPMLVNSVVRFLIQSYIHDAVNIGLAL